MRRSLTVGVIAAIASSAAMGDAVRSRPPGATVPTHRAVASTAHHGRRGHSHAARQPSVVIRYVPVVRVTTPYSGSLPRVAVPGPSPYLVISGSPAARELMTFTAAELPQNWNWTRVDSVVELVPRKVRDYCPDSRETFPAVEICPLPWLKTVP